MSKGSKAPAVQESKVTQTNLPPYAEPYYRSDLRPARHHGDGSPDTDR